ncbi:cholecystokinin receptor type A-like [Arapaima gigas]
METFTLHDALLNSTDLYRILCGLGLGIRNDSDCGGGAELPPAPRDMNRTVRIVLYCVIFLLRIVINVTLCPCIVNNSYKKNLRSSSFGQVLLTKPFKCLNDFFQPNTYTKSHREPKRGYFLSLGISKHVSSNPTGISVSVSTFNLVAISLERYSAICKPLSSRTWQTKSHAAKVISSTWVLSFLLMLPYPISSTLVPFTRHNNSTGNMCRLVWPSDIIQQSWYVFLLLLLFLVPGIIMMTAYGLISLELYRGIKFETMNRKGNREREASTGSLKPADGDGCYLQPSKKKQLELQQSKQSSHQGAHSSGSGKAKVGRVCSNSSTTNLMAKKRVIRMLIVIVSLFFLCWTPIFTVNAWRAFHQRSADQLLSGAPISFIHLLSYTSACVNPIIYCFMNKRFRAGVFATFACCSRQAPTRFSRTPTEDNGHTHSGGTLTRSTYSSIRGSAQA